MCLLATAATAHPVAMKGRTAIGSDREGGSAEQAPSQDVDREKNMDE
jgi:hypothetical protein